MQEVENMARRLMKNGFYAGSGYQMVWSRDLISLSNYHAKNMI